VLSSAGCEVPSSSFKLGTAIMKFKNPPVNSLSLDFLTEFVISLEKLENDKTFRGVILTSVGAIWSPESLEKSWR
jgi:enoyl-CoA hydratase/carnithine racemase